MYHLFLKEIIMFTSFLQITVNIHDVIGDVERKKERKKERHPAYEIFDSDPAS